MATTLPARTVLVADDDADTLDLTKIILQDSGYRVLAAATLAAALSYLDRFRVDVVLTDTFNAPLGDPERHARALLAAAGGAPVVIFSAHNADLFSGYGERGFANLVSKPFDIDHLATVVREATLRGRSAACAS